MRICDWTLTESICCPTWGDYSAELQAQAIRFATLVMWSATGRQFGPCEMVVYPCGRDTAGDWFGNAGYFWSDGVFVPYIWQGEWFNAACGCGLSNCWLCKPRCAVYLPGPVASVASVIIDGATIAAAAWRVLDEQWLVRTDGECWPLCQDYNAVDLSFQVTYSRGITVPPVVLDAAGVVACEYAKACLGQECQLPSRVVNIARQGVTVSLQDIDTLLRDGFTGISTVDQVIRQINPNRLTSQTRLFSFDVPVARTVTQA